MKVDGIITNHPQYAYDVVLGNKKIEWRKKNSFSDGPFFINEVKRRSLNLLMYITAPIKASFIVVELFKIEVGDPLRIYEDNRDVAGISSYELISYYYPNLINNNLFYFEGQEKQVALASGEEAYACHLQHCHLIDEKFASDLNQEIISKNLVALKGLRSVQRIDIEFDDGLVNKIW